MDPNANLLAAVGTTPSAPATAHISDPAAAKKAGEDFEAFFMSQAFESMFEGIGSDEMFGGGSGENVYRSLLIQEYSKVAAKSGGTGIGAAVTREILHLQEAQSTS